MSCLELFFLQLSDRRNVMFRDKMADLFNGEGQIVGGEASTSRLLHSARGGKSRGDKLQQETELPGQWEEVRRH